MNLIGIPFGDQSGRTSNSQTYEEMLDQELFLVEQRAQYQSAWFMLASSLLVYSLTFINSLQLSDDFRWFIDAFMILLVAWYLGTIFIINKGFYTRIFKYINIVFQVSLVSFFLLASARINSITFALSSVAPMFYFVVIGISSMTMNPFLCLLAGGIAAVQFLMIYAFWFHPYLDFAKADFNLFGWPAALIHMILYLIMGIVAMLMAKRARSLLETVVVQVRYEEQLKMIEREIEQAAQIQQHLIPTDPPQLNYLEIESFYSPSRLVGGDYIDYIDRPNGNHLVVVGDVSGKGLAAAMMMSSIQAMVRLYAQQDLPLHELLSSLNRSIFLATSQGRFVSMVCFEFDNESNQLSLVNCGHNAPMLMTSNGEFQTFAADYPVLGIQENQHFKGKVVAFHAGDLLFAYTDGLSELRNKEKRMFGVQAVEGVIKRCWQLRADQLKTTLVKTIQEYLDDEHLTNKNDDLSFICMRKLSST